MNQMNAYYEPQSVVAAPPAASESPAVSVTSEPVIPNSNGSGSQEEQSPPEPEREQPPVVTPEPVNTVKPYELAVEPGPAASVQQPVPPRTWASIVKKNGPGSVPVAATTAAVVPQPVTSGFSPASNTRPNKRLPHKPGPMRGNREGRIQHPDIQQVFVGNLPPDISEKQLRFIFGGFGTIIEVTIMEGSRYGFVVFDSEVGPHKALTFSVIGGRQNFIEVEGHFYTVDKKRRIGEERPQSGSRPGDRRDSPREGKIQHPDSQQVFVKNLPPDIREKQLRLIFGGFGTIIEVRMFEQCAFVVFDDEEAPRTVLRLPQGIIEFEGHRLKVEERNPIAERPVDRRDNPGDERIQHPDSQQVFLGNLPFDVSEETLRHIFMSFGTIIKVKIMRRKRCGFVVFDDEEAPRTVLRLSEVCWLA